MSEEEKIVEEEATKTDLRIKVYTVDKQEWLVKMGMVTEGEKNSVLGTLGGAFNEIRVNKSLTLVDRDGLTSIFNTDNVSCIQVESRE